MKNLFKLLGMLLLLVAFVSCDVLGGDSSTDDTDDRDNTALKSQWWIKGSFDNWAASVDDGTRHYFTVDELDSNILTFEIEDLLILDYEFVLVDGDDKEWKAPKTSATVSETAVVFTDVADDQTNATFKAAKTSYTVRVDISTPTAPSVTIIPGATDASAPDFALLASKLLVKGDAFTIGWTETAGTADETAKTVSFDVTMASKTGTFGFSSLDGFLKCDAIDSPTTAGSSATAVTLTTTASGNILINNPPKSDSVYTLVVTIDPTKTVAEGKYSMVVTLKTVGTTDWAFEAPAKVYLLGELSTTGWTNWSEADTGRAEISLTDKVATYTYTATASVAQKFKWAVKADSKWDGLIGYGNADISASPVTISDDSGNFLFTAVSGTSYTIKMDYSTTDYATSGKPKLTVTAN
ncbi:MAG: hypothetical protein JXR64_00165 [Spirochaetales bacterium]|nr:hypothetical protein [Spirochaetales bacterium]